MFAKQLLVIMQGRDVQLNFGSISLGFESTVNIITSFST